MRFTFLGTGTSSGVPAIGCRCAVCLSEDPRDRRLRTSGCLEFVDASGQPRVILLDAGPDLREQALRAGLDRLDAILLTHNHVDHTWGLDEVRRFNVLMDAPIDVYADAHTIEGIRRVFAHIFHKEGNVQKSFVASLIPNMVSPGRAFDLFGLRVTPFALLHGRLPILGYRLEASNPAAASALGGADLLPLAYCTDVSGIPPESWEHLRGLRTLVLDGLRHRHHPTHYTISQAVGVAHEVGARRTWFVHMSHDLPHEETNADLPDGMRLAHDGLVLP
ncbi:MAG: MBL fold metallo-hydrolase [Phycisphaerales bacterium]|nr:MBL fold metallo-hydrolase [Phycisphaerales bacterium]